MIFDFVDFCCLFGLVACGLRLNWFLVSVMFGVVLLIRVANSRFGG